MAKARPSKKRPRKRAPRKDKDVGPNRKLDASGRAELHFVIEDDIPMPRKRGPRGLAISLPLDEMKIGQSFEVKFDNTRWKSMTTMGSSMRSMVSFHENKFTVRKIDDDTYRVWRVEPDPE